MASLVLSPTFSELRRRVWRFGRWLSVSGSRVGGWLSRGQAMQPVLADLPRGETIGRQRMRSSLFGKKALPVFSICGPTEGFGKHIILLLDVTSII